MTVAYSKLLIPLCCLPCVTVGGVSQEVVGKVTCGWVVPGRLGGGGGGASIPTTWNGKFSNTHKNPIIKTAVLGSYKINWVKYAYDTTGKLTKLKLHSTIQIN